MNCDDSFKWAAISVQVSGGEPVIMQILPVKKEIIMTDVVIKPLPTEEVRRLQRGGKDANGQFPEVCISDGKGNPCRHCLSMIKAGEEFLIVAYKPFTTIQPYAEQGPLFLHKHECAAYQHQDQVPDILKNSAEFMVRGYDCDERIIYGTGKIVSNTEVEAYASSLIDNGDVRFVHVRSAANNCFQIRIDKRQDV
ncbi:MAG: DUF1203 domain-containing protein [Pseudomonadota bacterium]